MNGAQTIVGAGGVGLVVLNLWAGKSHSVIMTGLTNDKASSDQVAAAHAELKRAALALLGVGVAVVLAGLNRAWGSALVAVIVGLFILWAINKKGTP